MRRFLVLRLLVLVLCGTAGAPGEGRAAAGAALSPEGEGALQVFLTTSELVVGPNRFAFVLFKEHKLLEHARAVVHLYALQDQQGQRQAEIPASYTHLEVMEEGNRVHVHPDGTRHIHREETDVRGIYVAQVLFEHAGPWGLEVLAQQGDGPVETSRFTVQVLENGRTLALGAPAPRSYNLIASDVMDLRQIDTSDPPDPRLHQVRIADAIAQGKPQVIIFATPKFCTSRVCGPVVDIVRILLPTYGERIVFTHQEIWQDIAVARLFPTVDEWHLHTEPWIFVVDGKGIIRAKFQGLTTTREIAAVLEQVLDSHEVNTPGGLE